MYKIIYLNICIFLFLFSISNLYSQNNLNDIDHSQLLSNPSFPNYTLIEQKDLGEYKRVFWFKHNKTHADIVFTQDLTGIHQLLSISFRTMPFDDSGVFHIIEHAVLDSSKKYDVHNLFFKLKTSNIVTDMNAFTGPDSTIYRVSSYNNESFINLSNVYMDLVFNSNIEKYPEIFYREGIRREISSNNYLSYNGIVFNEVKNNLSFQDVLTRQYRRVLLKGTGYVYSHGGDVLSMIDLSYEDFVKTYKKYYHPSNSLIYFYGNSFLDIAERLEYLDKNYLSHYDYNPSFEASKKLRTSTFIPNSTKIYSDEYQVEEDTFIEENPSMVLGYKINHNDLEYTMVLNMIMDLIFNDSSSKYRQKLLESDLFEDIEAKVETVGGYCLVIITIKNTDPDNELVIKQKIQEVFSSVFNENISYDRSVLDALVNQQIFLQEQLKTSVSIDLSDYDKIEQGWINGNPLSYINTEDILKKLSSILKEPNFKFRSSIFFDVLNSSFLRNRNYYTGILSPRSTIMDERNEILYTRLLEEERNLDSYKIKQLKTIANNLKKYGESYSKVDTNIIPSISLNSVKKLSNDFYTPVSIQKDMDGTKILEFDSKSDRIDHIEMFWGISHLEEGELEFLSLLVSLMGNISTCDMDSLDINKNMNSLGNVNNQFRWFTTKDNKIVPSLVIGFDYFRENQDKIFSLMNDIIFNTRFDEKDKIKKLITILYLQFVTSSSLDSNYDLGDDISFVLSYIERLKSRTSGVIYLSFLKDVLRRLDNEYSYDRFINTLQSVYQKVFLNGSYVIGVRANSQRFSDIESSIRIYFNTRYNPSCFKVIDPKVEFTNSRRIFKKSTKVISNNEESTGYLFFVSPINLKLARSGRSGVISHFLNTYYLDPKIRNEGGAYSLRLMISNEGLLYFSSFADPDARSTLKVVQNIPEFLKGIKTLYKKDLSNIENSIKILALSEFDAPESISDIASRSFAEFFMGSTNEELLKKREDIINFSFRKDINDCISYFTQSIEEGLYKGRTQSSDSYENENLFNK